MEFLIKALQLILSLSILVILHEFGHFAFAKLFNTRVEKFYLFFDPWFSLFKFKKGETEYGIGWLPLGGYVKISGMIDESMDKEAMKEEPKPYEFRSKPSYQRLLIMIGGVLVNFLLAIVIFWMMLFYWGESYVPVKDAKFGLSYAPIAQEIGLKDGDIVTKVGSRDVIVPSDIARDILLENATTIAVKRGDSTFVLPIPADFANKIVANRVRNFADYRLPCVFDSIVANSNASKAKLLKGDSLLAINGEAASYYNQLVEKLGANSGKQVMMSVLRGKDTLQLSCDVSSAGKIGVTNKYQINQFPIEVKKYGFFEALPAGIDQGFTTLSNYVKQFKYVFTKDGAKQVGGFGAMGNLFPALWDWHSFWSLTAFFSIALAFMNILPIPALDGGHVLFLLYEMVTRRQPSEKFLEYSSYVGFVLLIGLILFANGNDLFRLFFK